MAFGFFKKKSDEKPPGDGENGKGPGGEAPKLKRDPRKAEAFFRHAQTVADFDYAIECFISGLRHDPGNITMRERLRETALRRMVGKGKPPTISEKMKGVGRDPVEKLLHAEYLWAKDPLNLQMMISVMERAVEVDKAEPDLHLGELAFMVGEMILSPDAPGVPNKQQLLLVRDLFVELERYDKAIEACKFALQMDRANGELIQSLKDLEAENTMRKARYSEAVKEGAMVSVNDMTRQKELEAADALDPTADRNKNAYESMLDKLRQAAKEKPEDTDAQTKLIAALIKKDQDVPENEAIAILDKLHKRLGEYRFKAQIGDLRMRQYNRKKRLLRGAVDADPKDAESRSEYDALVREQAEYELAEFIERSRNYPTDLGVRFELGRRFMQFKKWEDAIGAFQDSQRDPARRGPSLELLGRCYLAKGWLDEAIDSFRAGIDAHALPNDRLGLDLRYFLMDALEQRAEKTRNVETAREAQKTASQILQSNINHRDIRARMDKLRKLVDELSKPA